MKSKPAQAHVRVEDPEELRPKDLMSDPAPVYNLESIFAARRDLHPVMKLVVAGSGLSLPEADILLSLYEVSKLGWNDCRLYGDGFVSFKELKSVLLNDASLFTRRVNHLSSPSQQLVDVRRSNEVSPTLRGNSRFLRITEKGIGKAKVMFERYKKLAEEALKDFSPCDLETHRRVNEGLSRVLREWANAESWVLRLLE